MARGCCRNLPYVAVASTILAAVGLAIWHRYYNEAYDHAVDALATLGVSYPQLDKFQANALGYLICACIDLALLMLLALWRSSLLCQRDRYGSSSSLFTFLGSVIAAVTFCVAFWVVFNLVIMGAAIATFYIGHFAANTAGNELSKFGGANNIVDEVNKVITAYDSLADGLIPVAALDSINPTIDSLRPWVNGSSGGCPPFCLDMKTFKFLEVNTRCVCDSQVLKNAAVQAKDAGRAGLSALIGGFLLFVGLLWLLMNICGQVAGACSDKYHESRRDEEQYKAVQFQTA